MCFFFHFLQVFMATNENEQWARNIQLIEDFCINILSKYLQWLRGKCQFSIFSIINHLKFP